MITVPPYLQKGDTIAIVCPSGYMPFDKIETCIKVLQECGFIIKLGDTLGTQFNYFSGTDEARLTDIQTALDDEKIKAVLCARGGYGLSRIIDKIDFTKFIKNPKWIIGFSDVTILHSHLFQNYNIASLHSPMAAAFNDDEYKNEYVQSMLKALPGAPSAYFCEANILNKIGIATGELVGGNLSLLAHLIGTKSSIHTSGKILFIEDVGEYIYNIDRLMMQLQRAGMLANLAGLIVGSFSDMKNTIVPFGQSVDEAIWDKVKAYDYPVCFQFPVGHTKENYALKHGVLHQLNVAESGVNLTEMR